MQLDTSCRASFGHYSLERRCIKKVVAPKAKRACSKMLVNSHKLSERKACSLVGQNRSVTRYLLYKE
jgi:hypothetical protein